RREILGAAAAEELAANARVAIELLGAVLKIDRCVNAKVLEERDRGRRGTFDRRRGAAEVDHWCDEIAAGVVAGGPPGFAVGAFHGVLDADAVLVDLRAHELIVPPTEGWITNGMPKVRAGRDEIRS